MSLHDEIFAMIDDAKPSGVPTEPNSHLCADLGFDSLAFMQLLLQIEARYGFSFELLELGHCLRAGQLTALAEEKNRSLP